MTQPLVLAIDGGNSKTDLALVRADGEVVALVRGPLSSPHHLGLEGSLGVLGGLLAGGVVTLAYAYAPRDRRRDLVQAAACAGLLVLLVVLSIGKVTGLTG